MSDPALLREGFLLARRIAPDTCWRDASGGSCAWNHGFWQALRLIGHVVEPAHHTAAFEPAFERLAARGGRPRILISGTADWAMPAHVLDSLARRGLDCDLVVLDRCDTPLVLSRWHAERTSHALRTVRSDILDFDDAAGFDAVFTHSFIGQLPPQDRPALVERWRTLMKPGAVLATVNRLRPDAPGGMTRFSPEQARRLQDAVAAGWSRLADPPIPADEAVRMAAEYARHPASWPVHGEAELRALFEQAGFRVLHLSAAPIEDGRRAEDSGPTSPGRAHYAHLLVERPG